MTISVMYNMTINLTILIMTIRLTMSVSLVYMALLGRENLGCVMIYMALMAVGVIVLVNVLNKCCFHAENMP